jgi:hypothetical protein
MAYFYMIVSEVKLLSHVDTHVMSLGNHSLMFSGVWQKIASHELGQIALASIVLFQQGFVQPSVS